MTELISAAEAREISANIEFINEEEKVAVEIKKAASKKLLATYFAGLSDKITEKLRGLGYIVQKMVKGIEVSWSYIEPAYEEVEDKEALKDLLAGEGNEVYAEIKSELTIAKGEYITVPAGKKATIKLDDKINVANTCFKVEDGAELILKGEGVIESSNKSTAGSIVEANGPDAVVTIDGPTFDLISKTGKAGNYAFGIYLMRDASLNFKSGIVKTAYGSCISTNNTTGGTTNINITGGELYSDGSYAIYLASQGNVNVKGGKVQGINARMGHINVYGDAEIIPTTIDASGYDNIGVEFATSGCVWLGDTIAVMAGTYDDVKGIDTSITVSGNATVKSDFRSAIGIYCVDLNKAQNVKVRVADAEKVATTDADFDAIKVYDHAYILTEANKAGKTYVPVADSTVEIAA